MWYCYLPGILLGRLGALFHLFLTATLEFFIPQMKKLKLRSTIYSKFTQLDRKVEADFEPQTGSFQFVALTTPPWLISLYL